MLKKFLSAAAALCLGAVCMTGCGNIKSKSDDDKLSIVCTIFPQYDWAKQIIGSHSDKADITVLLDSGADLHNYQPTAEDMVKITNCDMFIYVGGESDGWVEDALKDSRNKDMQVINLLDSLGENVKEEEVKEGMQSEEEEEHGEEEMEYDEHVWLSLKNAETLCSVISDGLVKLDPENADDYKANSENYISKLSGLDSRYEEMIGKAAEKTLIFGDRFPFRYLADDYGLDYYAAFAGCSAETEASFETIAFLSGKADELGADTIFTIDGSDNKIAQSIIDNTSSKNQKIASLDSMQSVTAEKIRDGAEYYSIMESNYSVLEEALN